MNESWKVAGPAVRLEDVSKLYRLYRQPLYRLLDLLELCPPGPDYYTSHQALVDVNLEIGRGQKMAIIGRNGAGKSTLLKIITGLIKPSAGRVEVNGRISNLLQIGTGFHPDFTGRQNVFANLAHQGIVGREASRLFDEIVDFSEIEKYIDQPMKTYSTGMCSRLMFSASVMMKPELLIVDEILGVGDAYFSHKSFARMRDLCANDGTTLLLVTHDIYSALNLCDRFIWIDQGRVCFDGAGKDAIARYEASVKEQEEAHLRHQHVTALLAHHVDPVVHVALRSRTGFALTKPCAISEIELMAGEGRSLLLRVADGAGEWHLMPESNLGEPEVVSGERCRSIRTFGSIYHKAEWSVRLPEQFDLQQLRVRWEHEGDVPMDVRVHAPNGPVLIRGELPAVRQWQDATFARVEGRQENDTPGQVDYGTGAIRITAMEFEDRHGNSVTQIQYGEPLTVRIHCNIQAVLPESEITFCIGFARETFTYQAYVYQEDLPIPPSGEFVIESTLDDVRLGSGLWYVNVGIGAARIFRRTTIPYFTVDSAWYHLITSRVQFRVLSVTKFDAGGCFYQMPARIAVKPTTSVSA
jgi:homopolymeric O-antigen transport system ATP-binding protein